MTPDPALFSDCPYREVGKTVMKCVQVACDGTHHYFVGS